MQECQPLKQSSKIFSMTVTSSLQNLSFPAVSIQFTKSIPSLLEHQELDQITRTVSLTSSTKEVTDLPCSVCAWLDFFGKQSAFVAYLCGRRICDTEIRIHYDLICQYWQYSAPLHKVSIEFCFSSCENYSLRTQLMELRTAQCKLWHEGLLHPQ